MKPEASLDFSQSSYTQITTKSKQTFLRRHISLFFLLGFVLIIGTFSAFLLLKTTPPTDTSIITTSLPSKQMKQYSRILTVQVQPNSSKVPSDSNLHSMIQSELMVLNFYQISENLIAIEVADQQEITLDSQTPDISKISYNDFQHDIHSPNSEIYYLILDNSGHFSKLLADPLISKNQLEKIKHTIQQYSTELDASLYSIPTHSYRSTKLGQAKMHHEKAYEDSEKLILRNYFHGGDISKQSSFQNLDEQSYNFEQLHHFSKLNNNNLELSDLHENYNFETKENDLMALGLAIQTHQKLQFIKTKPITLEKSNQLLTQYYAMQDTAQQILTLTPTELSHTSDYQFAQNVKDQLFPGSSSCPIKERSLQQQSNDNIQTITKSTVTVYDHKQQSMLGFSFKIVDDISIYLDLTNSTLIFDNQLILQIQRDSCTKEFTLIEFNVPMTANFTWDLNMIEVAAESWLNNLETFFKGIYDKFQDFLQKIKAEGIHSNSTWTGIDPKKRNLDSLKGDLDTIKGDLSKWNQDIVSTLSHTSKQYHYSKPISFEYNLDFYGITLQFGFGFTFGLDGSYSDNLLELYLNNKQVLLNYIDILEQDYNQDLQSAQQLYKQLTQLLDGCSSGPSEHYHTFKQWDCQEDSTELDYICTNTKNYKKFHITKKYYDYIQQELSLIPNECITTAVKDLMQEIIDQLKSFWQLRETKFLNLLNLTYIPEFKGDVYIQGYVKLTLVPWINKLSMSIKLEGDLLKATANLGLEVNAKPFFTGLVSLVEKKITPDDYLKEVESAVSFNFNFDVQVVNVTLTFIADAVVVDFILDIADVMKGIWGQHTLRVLDQQQQQQLQEEDFHLFDHSHAIFGDIFKDAAHKFESGLEEVIADLYCEFFTNAEGIAAAFTPESIPLFEFLWANAGCSLPDTTLEQFSASSIRCDYSTDFQVKQLYDPSKYKTA